MPELLMTLSWADFQRLQNQKRKSSHQKKGVLLKGLTKSRISLGDKFKNMELDGTNNSGNIQSSKNNTPSRILKSNISPT